MDEEILTLQTQLLQLANDTAAKRAAWDAARVAQNAKLDQLITEINERYRVE